jgi:isocitrate dehydrogenase (NAD+)
MKLSDGLFLKCCRAVSKDYPDVEYSEVLVDSLCTQLVMKPEKFEVLVLQNLYGDMISDLCAGLVGGLGVAPGGNIGDELAVFEAVHGTAPDIAGKGVANPLAMILSGAMMLEYLKEDEAAARVRLAVESVVKEARCLTRDLGGTATTVEVAEAVATRTAQLKRGSGVHAIDAEAVATVRRSSGG